MLTRYVASVEQFMKKHGQFVGEYPKKMPADVCQLRKRLIVEEMAEMRIAFHEKNLVEVADAMADFIYVVVGTAIAAGAHQLPEFTRYARLTDQWIEGPATLPEDLPTKAMVDDLLDNLQFATALVVVNLGEMPSESIADGLGSTVAMVTDMAKLCHIPLNPVFDEVHRSNMSKPQLDKNNKGGKVTKEGFVPPNLPPILGIVANI